MRRPKRTLQLRLWDIIHAIEVGRKAVGGLPLSEFRADEVRVFAAERSIAVISDASRHIPPEVTKRFDIPWIQISSIGNIIRHGYDIVD